MAESPDFDRVLASGRRHALASQDFTAKAEVLGLEPRTLYHFRWGVAGEDAGAGGLSPVGRFKTLPAPGSHVPNLEYAVFSCSHYRWGFFNAYRDAAHLDLDFWMHVGDFIYEMGEDAYPRPEQAVRPRGLGPAHEAVTLEDYRERYATYRGDPDLQALSAAAALIAVWDDHEIADNPWMHGANAHQPETEGDWETRKQAAVRAYHEWMPTRSRSLAAPPAEEGSDAGLPFLGPKIYRKFDFGDLATLVVLETRLLARTDPNEIPYVFGQVAKLLAAANVTSLDGFAGSTAEQEVAKLREELEAYRRHEDKVLAGPEQLEWVRSVFEASKTSWNLLGQQTIMQEQRSADLAGASDWARRQGRFEEAAQWAEALANLTGGQGAAGPEGPAMCYYSPTPYLRAKQGTCEPVSDYFSQMVLAATVAGREGITYNYDQWSGYVRERERLLDATKSSQNTIVYSGDSHNAWAGVVRDRDGHVAALEYAGTSVSSPGTERSSPMLSPEMVRAGYLVANPDMEHSDNEHKGFMLFNLTHDRHHGEFIVTPRYDVRQMGHSYCSKALNAYHTHGIRSEGDILVPGACEHLVESTWERHLPSFKHFQEQNAASWGLMIGVGGIFLLLGAAAHKGLGLLLDWHKMKTQQAYSGLELADMGDADL